MLLAGRVAEWPIAAVLKTAVGQPTVGSNPTSSEKRKQFEPLDLSRRAKGLGTRMSQYIL